MWSISTRWDTYEWRSLAITLRWDRSTSAGRLSWTPWRNVRRAPKHALLPERTDWKADRDLLGSGFHPTAIICVNDFMAVGVLRELREQGIRVPQEISVTGFDNIKLAEFCSPALTTAHIPREQIGQIIFQSLVPDPEKEQLTGREIVIEPELVVRESTGPVRNTRGAAGNHEKLVAD